MKYSKLKEFCDLQNGYAFKSEDYVSESNTLVCRMSNIRPDATFDIKYNAKYVPDDFTIKYNDFILKDGDVIIAMTDMANDPRILGVPTIIDTKGYNLLLNQRVGKIKTIDLTKIHLPYLKVALARRENKSYFKKFAGGGLQLNVGKNDILNLKIPLPSIPDQIHIANLLSKAENLISQRKESIRLLDEYLKSTFLEMFYSNPLAEKWSEVKFEALAAKKKGSMRSGPFGSSLLHSEFSETGDVKVLGIDNVVKNRFEWKRNRCISNEKFQELKRYQVFPNDVLISIMATLGRTAVVPQNIPICINSKHLAAITLDLNIANPYFVSYAFYNHPSILKQMSNSVIGAIMDGLNLTIIRNINLKCPPIELQTQFAQIVEKTESLKAQYQQSLQELEQLYGSLSQRAFKGELTVKNSSLGI